MVVVFPVVGAIVILGFMNPPAAARDSSENMTAPGMRGADTPTASNDHGDTFGHGDP
jgi:hypothetical protein